MKKLICAAAAAVIAAAISVPVCIIPFAASEKKPQTTQTSKTDSSAAKNDSGKTNEKKSSETQSKEIEKSLKTFSNTTKKYHTYDIWFSIACTGRMKKNSANGYYKKGELIRIIGKYRDSKTVIVYTTGDGVNYLPAADIEFLPKDYKPEKNEYFNDMPTLPASQVLEETDVYTWEKSSFGLPCYVPKDEYSDDYDNSLEVKYDKSMIRRYGRLERDLTIYNSNRGSVQKTTVPKGAYVGVMEYRYGEIYGYFTLYNNGGYYSLAEFINDNWKKPALTLMDEDFKPSSKDKVYGMDDATEMRRYALVEQVKTDRKTAIMTVTPSKEPMYIRLIGSEITLINFTRGQKISVLADEGSNYLCIYNDRAFRISKNIVRKI